MTRVPAIDSLRGLLLILMAIDHVSLFVANHHAFEFWGGAWSRHTDPAWFLTRFVTHLCAPGFFFLMGAGMPLFSQARQAAGWPGTRIRSFLIKRGLLFLVINQLLENPAWILGTAFRRAAGPPPFDAPPPGVDGSFPYLALTVISALGLAMAAAAWFVEFRWAGALGAVLLVVSGALTPSADHAAAIYHPLLRLLLIPGQSKWLFVLYPVIPWLGVTLIGVAFGRWILRDSTSAFRYAPWIGLASIAAALALRVAGSFGNLRLPRDATWIEFLNFIKYPPALVFALSMAGANLLLLVALKNAPKWLSVFGQAPLFYYLAHLYLYAIIGVLFFRDPGSIGALYLIWLLGLPLLYVACRRFRVFKAAKPVESLWRLF